jgi:hypothetical protein
MTDDTEAAVQAHQTRTDEIGRYAVRCPEGLWRPGALGPMAPVAPGDKVTVEIGGLDTVRALFA